ncbi:hypothetical protein ABEY80_16920 [Priestia megaterium]
MIIPVKRTRGTKFIPLIRILEGLGENAEIEFRGAINEFLEEIFEDDLEISNFFKWEIAFEAEFANMLLDYLCASEPLIKEYFTGKGRLKSEYKNICIEIQQNEKLLIDYVKRFSADHPVIAVIENWESLQLPIHSFPLMHSFFLLTAKMQLDIEFTAKFDQQVDKYNAIWKKEYFQTTIFNNLITIICSLLNALHTNLSAFEDNSSLTKLNNARKVTMLQILNLICTEFKIPLKTIAASILSIPMSDLEILINEINASPSIGSIIKQIERRERQKERLSPPDPDNTSNEFYISRPVSAFDVQLEQLKPLIPVDIDLDNLDSLDDEKLLQIYKEIFKKRYELL